MSVIKLTDHLNKVTTVDKKTGKEEPANAEGFMLGAPKDKCQECAVDHKSTQPHNKNSMFYQYKFYNEHGRWPTWKDALAHCSEEVQGQWVTLLLANGEKID